jgi:glutamyl-tRNA synthetase
MESLTWLGLDWDYGPDKPGPFGSTIQSERLESYRKFAQKLADQGLAYPDPFTEGEVEEFRKKAESEKRPFLFREHRPETFGVWDGKQPLRFKVPTIKRYEWTDAVRGTLDAGEEALDDFILMKGDGYPTYNFAHIIDDHHMGVTHIFRADEFISSTPRFLSLYDALGIPYPVFVTLPPILREDKTKKLGKRDGAKDILEYRKEGFLPDALRNYLAFIGWNPGTEQELFSLKELIESFTIERVQTHGAVFNEEKLLWFNKEHVRNLPDDVFLDAVKSFIPSAMQSLPGWDENVLQRALPVLRDHIHTFGDIARMAEAGEMDFYFSTPTPTRKNLGWKETPSDVTATHLKHVIGVLESQSTWTPEALKEALWEYASEKGRGEVLWPTRFALSGREKSPDPFTLAYILGKTSTLDRLHRALATIEG